MECCIQFLINCPNEKRKKEKVEGNVVISSMKTICFKREVGAIESKCESYEEGVSTTRKKYAL